MENKKLWYAVMQGKHDTDWGFGSFDLEDAMVWARHIPKGYIAVIDGGYDADGNATTDEICVDEIHPSHKKFS